jgi:hypothetical protein
MVRLIRLEMIVLKAQQGETKQESSISGNCYCEHFGAGVYYIGTVPGANAMPVCSHSRQVDA